MKEEPKARSGRRRGAGGKKARRRTTKRAARPDKTGARIYDVAEEAGVSVVTVSRVFNDYPHVSGAMRRRVLEAARRAGYRPRLVSNRRNVLAVLLGDTDQLFTDGQIARLLFSLLQAAAARGYLVEFLPARSIELATQHLVSGLIEIGLPDEDFRQLDHLPPIPKVALNNRQVDDDWNVVCIDPAGEIRMAVGHLLDQGHHNIALVDYTSDQFGVDLRAAAFSEAMHEAGTDGHHIFRCTKDSVPMETARRILATGCTACISFCTHGGLPLLYSLQNDLQVKVPEDMSVVGLENERVSPFLKPRLTTLAQPLKQMARTAVDGLLRQISGEQPERFVTALSSRLIIRDSVRRFS